MSGVPVRMPVRTRQRAELGRRATALKPTRLGTIYDEYVSNRPAPLAPHDLVRPHLGPRRIKRMAVVAQHVDGKNTKPRRFLIIRRPSESALRGHTHEQLSNLGSRIRRGAGRSRTLLLRGFCAVPGSRGGPGVRKGVVKNHRHPPCKAVKIVTNQRPRFPTFAP